jgi:hypothetical protein
MIKGGGKGRAGHLERARHAVHSIAGPSHRSTDVSLGTMLVSARAAAEASFSSDSAPDGRTHRRTNDAASYVM